MLDVLVTADKFDVKACVISSCEILLSQVMTTESALLYLGLPYCILLSEGVWPLASAAKQYLVDCYKNATSENNEVLELPKLGFETVFSNDDLQVASEDIVFSLVLKWCRARYPQPERRRGKMIRFSYLIRFGFMSCRMLKRAVKCTDFDPEFIQKNVLEAFSFKADPEYRQRMLLSNLMSTERKYVQRLYTYQPVKVVEQDHLPMCTIYLEIAHAELTRLLGGGRIDTEIIYYQGQAFFVSIVRNLNPTGDQSCFGLYVGMAEKGLRSRHIEYKLSCMVNLLDSYTYVEYVSGRCELGWGFGVGIRDFFDISWDDFIAEDMIYFVKGVLNLKVDIAILQL